MKPSEAVPQRGPKINGVPKLLPSALASFMCFAVPPFGLFLLANDMRKNWLNQGKGVNDEAQ